MSEAAVEEEEVATAVRRGVETGHNKSITPMTLNFTFPKNVFLPGYRDAFSIMILR